MFTYENIILFVGILVVLILLKCERKNEMYTKLK